MSPLRQRIGLAKGAGRGWVNRLLWPLIGGMGGLLVLAAVYTSGLIIERQAALRQVSRYNSTWLASQAVVEIARLQQRISAYALGDGLVSKEEVELRLDILANRVGVLRGSRDIADLMAAQPELGEVITRLAEVVRLGQPMVARLEPADQRRLLDLLSPIELDLLRFAAAANVHGGDRVAEDQGHLSRLHWLFSSILLVLALCGLALLALLLLHNRLLRRTHEELLARTTELHIQNERFDAALNNMSHALCMVDAEQRLIVCNRRYAEFFGLPPRLTEPRTAMDEILRHLAEAGGSAVRLATMVQESQQPLIRDGIAGSFICEEGEGRALFVSHRPMPGGGWIATYEDITERRRTEARIAYMAHYDAVTGLPNRVLFREKMEQEMERLKHHRTSFAILCLDLDHFKNINDTLGHSIGDLLLEAVAQRLRGCVQEGDTVARLSGDEFAILQPAQKQPQAARALSEQIVQLLCAPYEIGGHRVVISASIGVALAPADGDDADELLKNADVALYRAKASGRSAFRFFEPEMHVRLRTRLALEADLRDALGKRQLEMYYQPLLDLGENRICAFEALLRWRHPERGLVPPAQFIPVAEDTGLIIEIGEWVLRQACADASGWPCDIKVAVNLSPLQFLSPRLSEAVSHALEVSSLPPSRLELEVTESVLLQESEAILALLHELRAMGLRIALDDFGTGYSSLSYLRSFPFDKVKIDQSFVRALSEDDSRTIVDAIVNLASGLGMTATAEGIETAEQLRQIRRAGCAEAQGYYIGRPQPAGIILAALGQRAGRPEPAFTAPWKVPQLRLPAR